MMGRVEVIWWHNSVDCVEFLNCFAAHYSNVEAKCFFAISQDIEPWVSYYDIFVDNAFGNYFDVMKQVCMGSLLYLA